MNIVRLIVTMLIAVVATNMNYVCNCHLIKSQYCMALVGDRVLVTFGSNTTNILHKAF